MRSLTAFVRSKAEQFTQWMAWAVWNHARRRAIRREPWMPEEARVARGDESPETRRIRANEARQMLENRHFRDAWNSLHASLQEQALSCDIDAERGREKACRIVVSMQLLHGLRREFERKLDDGYMAEAELDELNRRRQVTAFRR